MKVSLREVTVVFIALLSISVSAYPPPPTPTATEAAAFRTKITRSLGLLEQGKAIKIVFFGQSLQDASQLWVRNFDPWIRGMYKNATITISNRSVAGCSSDCLGPKVQAQIEGQNADLIIFHVYANSEASYEDVIKKIKQYSPTTMELLVFNDHIHNGDRTWHDLWSNTLLPAICQRNNVGMLNIRDPWKRYLVTVKKVDAYSTILTSDGVHFNDEGHYLMLELMKRYITGIGGVSVTIPAEMISPDNTYPKSNIDTRSFNLQGSVVRDLSKAGQVSGIRIIRTGMTNRTRTQVTFPISKQQDPELPAQER